MVCPKRSQPSPRILLADFNTGRKNLLKALQLTSQVVSFRDERTQTRLNRILRKLEGRTIHFSTLVPQPCMDQVFRQTRNLPAYLSKPSLHRISQSFSRFHPVQISCLLGV